MQTFYLIREYDMIGAKLFTYKPIEFTQVLTINKGINNKILSIVGLQDKNEVIYESDRFYEISEIKKGISHEEKFLPYTATAKEDLPGYFKRKDCKVWYNCKLMTETHGGYKQFYHPPTKEVLRIAMNSNIYEPAN